MKSLFLGFISTVFFNSLFSQSFTPVDNGSRVHFVIDNFGIGTGGNFTGLSGTIKFDPANPTTADFDVSVDAASIDTDIESRDNHLRRTEYFDVKKYPKLLFKSTRVTKANKNGYLYVFGQITIKGVTKEINFPFTVTPKNNDFLFEGTFKLNRRDFGVGKGSISLSDNLTVSLSIYAKAK
jgi:polyisoprenoid-binding protein YceI